jgi:hypothetical protein
LRYGTATAFTFSLLRTGQATRRVFPKGTLPTAARRARLFATQANLGTSCPSPSRRTAYNGFFVVCGAPRKVVSEGNARRVALAGSALYLVCDLKVNAVALT